LATGKHIKRGKSKGLEQGSEAGTGRLRTVPMFEETGASEPRKVDSLDSSADNNLPKLAEEITKGWHNGRVPLFLFGSGGTPNDLKPFEIVQRILNCKKIPNPTRLEIARIFGDLQEDEKKWNEFCDQFLSDWIAEFDNTFGEKPKKDKFEQAQLMYGRIDDYLFTRPEALP
jgi:hypothetical protein